MKKTKKGKKRGTRGRKPAVGQAVPEGVVCKEDQDRKKENALLGGKKGFKPTPSRARKEGESSGTTVVPGRGG